MVIKVLPRHRKSSLIESQKTQVQQTIERHTEILQHLAQTGTVTLQEWRENLCQTRISPNCSISNLRNVLKQYPELSQVERRGKADVYRPSPVLYRLIEQRRLQEYIADIKLRSLTDFITNLDERFDNSPNYYSSRQVSQDKNEI